MPQPDRSDAQLDAELDALLEQCLLLPETEWEDAVARAAETHTHLADRLGRRLEALKQFGLVDNGSNIGPYTLVRQLGSGSTGQVFLARRDGVSEEFAIKLLHPGLRMSATALRRFQRERELVANLDHPSFCQIHDSGLADGVPYIVMDHVEGENLREFASHCRGDWRQLVRVLAQTARALHRAHEAGLAHRDVKPTNILVRSDGTPVLLDFGLARNVESQTHSLTQANALLGSPAYLAPEAIHENTVLGTRSDIYALGVTMFECLTGELPFTGATQAALFYSVLNDPTRDPTAVVPELPTDLGTVVRVAMARAPGQRYASAAALASDLDAVHAGRSIAARLPGRLAHTWDWIRRNPRVSVFVVLLVLSLALAIVSQRHEQAIGLAHQSKTMDPIPAVRSARRALELYEHPTTLNALHEAVARCRKSVAFPIAGLRFHECAFLPGGRGIIAKIHGGELWAGTMDGVQLLSETGVRTFAADDEGILVAYVDRIDRITYSGERTTPIRGRALSLSITANDVAVIYIDPEENARFEYGTRPVVALPEPQHDTHWRRAFVAQTGQRLFLASADHTVYTDWSGAVIGELPGAVEQISADGDSCIIKTATGRSWIRVTTGALLAAIPDDSSPGRLALSPDGKLLACTRRAREVEVFEQSGRVVGRIADHGVLVHVLSFAPTSRKIMIGDGDGVVRLYDETGRFLSDVRGHAGFISAVAFHPTEPLILTASDDQHVRAFHLHPGIDHHRWGHSGNIHGLDVAGDGRVLSCDDLGELRLWQPGELGSTLIGEDVRCACFAGDSIALGTEQGKWLITSADRDRAHTLPAPADGNPIDVIAHDNRLATLKTNPLPSGGSTIRLWEEQSSQWSLRCHIEVPTALRSVDFHNATQRIVCAGSDGKVRQFEFDGQPLQEFDAHDAAIWSVRFAPEGDEILTASRDNRAILWTLDGAQRAEFIGHLETVSMAVFSPAGDRVATTSADGTVRLWRRDGEALAVLRGHRGQVWAAAFSRDGQRLTSGAYDRELRTWPLGIEELLRHAGELVTPGIDRRW